MAEDLKAGARAGVPDTMGDRGRAQVVADMLAGIQEQAWTLEVEVVANDLSADAFAPVPPGQQPSGETVADRRAKFAAATARLEAQFAHLMPLISTMFNTTPPEGSNG
jgi:hypothetical protein